MKNLIIYRNLPFRVWHKPFDLTGSDWRPGGYRSECDCPYGKHSDVRYLDHKDPLCLKEILSLEEGEKLLTFHSWKGTERIAYHTFNNIEFYSDFMHLLFKEKVDVCEHGGHGEQFTSLRLIAVIDDANGISAFGKIGGIDVFIKELSKLTDIPTKDIEQQINKLDKTPIPPELKFSTEEITENAKKSGNLAPIFR